MAKQQTLWHCETCKTGYEDKAAAEYCEHGHPPLENITVHRVLYKKPERYDHGAWKMYPETVTLALGHEGGANALARYRLVSVGMGGL